MRSQANKNYRTFVGGLITEASPLTYPENATTAEDNCVIFRKGNRTRRLGVRAEEGFSLLAGNENNNIAQNTPRIDNYSWESVNENGETDLLVQRIGNFVYFYNHVSETPLSDERLSYVIDLRNYAVVPGDDVAGAEIEFANGKGYLFIVGETIEPLNVEYLPDSQSFTIRQIEVKMRDFQGVDDGLPNDEEPAVLTPEHFYNLRNQGWVIPTTKNKSTTTNVTAYNGWFGGISRALELAAVDATTGFSNDPIQRYRNQLGVYPANNKQWWVARLEVDNPDRNLKAGEFDPQLLCETYFGNTRAPRGHYILNAFDKDRSGVSGIQNLERVTRNQRPNATAFYAGRVWYGSESTVYFSQTLEDYRQAGTCYQEADPTSEAISDLIASDGGVIPIPEAHNIKRMYPLGGGLLVFAENGLWFINGGSSNGFSAIDVAVSKISSNGILGKDTLVEADGTIYWWAPSGIMSLTQQSGIFGAQDGAFDRVNISETTIQSYYNNCIPAESKLNAKGIYDPLRNLVQWLFADEKVTPSISRSLNGYNNILNLDVTLGAFYPWSLTVGEGLPILTGFFRRTLVKQIQTPGFTSQKGPDTFSTLINYTFSQHDNNRLRTSFCDFREPTFADWIDYDGVGQSYLSYMETGYELLEDLMRDKQQNYVFYYFRRTDRDGTGPRSSCWVRTKWDWSNSEISNRWSRRFQACREDLRRFRNSEVISTKHKARGQGRAIQLRAESDEIGTTFDFLGWATNYTGETRV